MHGGGVLVQIREDWSERLARVQLLRRLRILGVHVHNEVRIWSKERHLAFRIATIGAMRVGLNEFSDRETICGFAGRGCQVLAHESASLRLNCGAGLSARRSARLPIFLSIRSSCCSSSSETSWNAGLMSAACRRKRGTNISRPFSVSATVLTRRSELLSTRLTNPFLYRRSTATL